MVTPSVYFHIDGPYREILEKAGLEVVYPSSIESVLEPQTLIRELDGIDAVVASVEPYPREVLAACKLKAIARMGVGFDSVDLDAATENGIVVTITPGTNEHSVAEMAIALITGVSRGLPWRYQEVLTGKWTKRKLPRLAGQTLGLVGLGRIGKAMVPRALGLGLRVLAYDPYIDEDFCRQAGVKPASLDQLLSSADIVSLHLPATAETADLINANSLAQMKQGSVLINTSRGGLVDEDALAAALQSGHLAGAGLDVFKVEPLPLTSPLLQCPTALLMPHLGGLDVDSERAMGNMAAECIVNLFQNRWPEECVINKTVRDGWKW